MATKMVAVCLFALVDTLTKSFVYLLFSNFIYVLLLSISHPIMDMGFYHMNTNQDGCWNNVEIAATGNFSLNFLHRGLILDLRIYLDSYNLHM